MLFSIQAIVLLTTLSLTVLVEARWHNLKPLHNKHRLNEEQKEELTKLLSEMDEKYSDLIKSEEFSLIRHRRHHPVNSERSESFKELSNDETEDSEAEENLEYDDLIEMQRVPRHRLLNHRKHGNLAQAHHLRHYHNQPRHETRDYESDPLDMNSQESDYSGDSDTWKHTRAKRHHRRKYWTDKDKKAYNASRPKPIHFDNEKAYELEVREAQNSSLCNYTVIPIPDPGGRIPRVLEHVKCNYAGSRCQDRGTYCCIQTYRNVEVAYEDDRTEVIKVYSGCVCSLQIFGTLEPYIPDLSTDLNY